MTSTLSSNIYFYGIVFSTSAIYISFPGALCYFLNCKNVILFLFYVILFVFSSNVPEDANYRFLKVYLCSLTCNHLFWSVSFMFEAFLKCSVILARCLHVDDKARRYWLMALHVRVGLAEWWTSFYADGAQRLWVIFPLFSIVLPGTPTVASIMIAHCHHLGTFRNNNS